MVPIGPKRKILSAKAVEHHNLATKGPMCVAELSKPELDAKENFPAEQKSCTTKCKLPGCHRISLTHKRLIYSHFFRMTDDERYLFQTLLMSTSSDVRDDKNRKWTYLLPLFLDKVEVCQTTFIATLDISESQVRRFQQRMTAGELLPRNMRGRHNNRPHRLVDETLDLITEHLLSYPKVENDYARQKYDEDTMFLSSDLTVSRIYTEYMELHGRDNPVSESKFRQIFVGCNFKIGTPKSDTCDTCDYLNFCLKLETCEAKKLELGLQKELHMKSTELAYSARKHETARSRLDPNYVVLVVDMMQTICTPKLSCSTIFYARKFSTFTVGIHDERTNKGNMFVWHETDAKKGSDEVVSCLYKYIAQPLQGDQDRRLVVWSDRCAGQNNNFAVLTLYRRLIDMGYFTGISQKFAVSGHSYLSCDTDFAFIERKLRKVDYLTPTALPNVIISAYPSQPFNVFQMTKDDFYSLTPVLQYWKRPSRLKVSEYLVFHQDNSQCNSIWTKTEHTTSDSDWETFQVKYYGRDIDPRGIPPIDGLKKYENFLELAPEKERDLIKLMKFLKPADRPFYTAHLPHYIDDQTGDDIDIEDDHFGVVEN